MDLRNVVPIDGNVKLKCRCHSSLSRVLFTMYLIVLLLLINYEHLNNVFVIIYR